MAIAINTPSPARAQVHATTSPNSELEHRTTTTDVRPLSTFNEGTAITEGPALVANEEDRPRTVVEVRPQPISITTKLPVMQNRRVSLKPRDSILRVMEVKRRRQRWENDHFFHNPHAVQPTKADWEVRPVYPRREVLYQYAFLWEHPNFRRSEKSNLPDVKNKVPRDLKVRLKKAHGAISLLETLEKEVRSFLLQDCGEDQMDSHASRGAVSYEESDVVVDFDSDEEVVFISKGKKNLTQQPQEKVLLESLVDDSSASFGRWLVHCIAGYYGLQSWSITSGTPAKRYAYVAKPSLKSAVASSNTLPKPLYMMI